MEGLIFPAAEPVFMFFTSIMVFVPFRTFFISNPVGMNTFLPSLFFLIVKDSGRLILKNIKEVAVDLKEDLIFAERVEKSWQDYDRGKFVTKSKEDFLKELRAC